MGAFHESLCLNLQCHSSGNLLSIVSQLSFPDAGAKIRRLLMNYLQYFSTKKVGSYADTHIYSSTFVSLKTLIYSEIYIKPLKTSLFTFFLKKMESIVSFATTCKTDSYPPHSFTLYSTGDRWRSQDQNILRKQTGP